MGRTSGQFIAKMLGKGRQLGKKNRTSNGHSPDPGVFARVISLARMLHKCNEKYFPSQNLGKVPKPILGKQFVHQQKALLVNRLDKNLNNTLHLFT
ncbi:MULTISPECIES: hypothetical protein [unclassified Synechocystis]|uniref:hypothetical protein n=1 Tax=unclassified Synechocystis TaxID=2640012 RepID=UPI00059B963A|nr:MULTISPECIES: hypothetical protein [unclassified Synechocystis]MBD2618381.1 hypothetical protein [Synechocystis sp. FACHB-898]MBD2640050.1 hypothetical protein [Synechocystis sp. FACHB-908]MBD2660945.1 hypothetical protein [Synechocystis sp. FACHB-929]MCW5241031.1 hypothetical protein [Synechocystis sp. PCC 6803]NHL98819.1 hypothetical protein [Synechocystis sp. PCC 6803]